MIEDDLLMCEILRVINSSDEFELVRELGWENAVLCTIRAALEKDGLLIDVRTSCEYTENFLHSNKFIRELYANLSDRRQKCLTK